jgi:chromosomal replication initiation ATPase DnaA
MKLEVFNQYTNRVCELFKVEKGEIFSNNKQRRYVDARHLLFILCHRRPMSTSYIQKYIADEGGNISHSSIAHGIKVMQKKVTEDKDIETVIKEIENAVYI